MTRRKVIPSPQQREILKEYLKLHPDIEFYDFYVDDGWSGTTFDRPDFKRMMEDIYSGKVNCVIAKDLNEMGLPNPTRYKQMKGFNYRQYYFWPTNIF